MKISFKKKLIIRTEISIVRLDKFDWVNVKKFFKFLYTELKRFSLSSVIINNRAYQNFLMRNWTSRNWNISQMVKDTEIEYANHLKFRL